jgi:SAM-dependent methyltransferase
MRTRIESKNPFGYDRYGFAWQRVPAGGAAHLDFGCGDGRFLEALQSKGIQRLVGVDASKEAVRRAAERPGDMEIVHVRSADSLPFADGEFSSISLMDVLEHVDRQEALLAELRRILQDDGILIVTVPRQHVFSCMDIGNLKFRLPRLHRGYYCRRYSKQEYERRYVRNPDGLIGDVAAEKRWHEHFSRRRLEELLHGKGFSVVQFDGTGFFRRLLKIAEMLFGRIGLLRRGLARIVAWDARRFESANLFCAARKRTRARQGPE